MRSILVVDDDVDYLETTVDLLKFHGYAVTSAGNGQEGLIYLETHTFDAILTDYRMGEGLNGLEFYERVCNQFSRIPCALVTSDATDTSIKEKAKNLEVLVVSKSVDNSELVEIVSALIRT